MTQRTMVEISLDSEIDAAYVALSDHEVARTCQVNDEVLVDLDEHDVVVGIEVLRIDAELPFAELTDRYHVHSDVVGLLRLMRPTVSGFVSWTFSQGHDGVASAENRRTLPVS